MSNVLVPRRIARAPLHPDFSLATYPLARKCCTVRICFVSGELLQGKSFMCPLAKATSSPDHDTPECHPKLQLSHIRGPTSELPLECFFLSCDPRALRSVVSHSLTMSLPSTGIIPSRRLLQTPPPLFSTYPGHLHLFQPDAPHTMPCETFFSRWTNVNIMKLVFLLQSCWYLVVVRSANLVIIRPLPTFRDTGHQDIVQEVSKRSKMPKKTCS